MDVLLDDYTVGIINRNELKYTQDRLGTRKAAIDMELDKLQRAQFNISLEPGETVRQAWMDRPDGWRRALVEMLINEITISKGLRKPFYDVDGRRTRFDKDRVTISWK